MYKLLLCARYLRTRYLAFVCIVSIMLGVATLIVVNAVMSGFSTKLKAGLNGQTADVIVETDRHDGLYVPGPDGRPLSPDALAGLIEQNPVLGPKVAAVAPTAEMFAILQFKLGGAPIVKPVKLIGVDPARRAKVGGFAEYLVRQKGAAAPSFDPTPAALKVHAENKERVAREAAELVLPQLEPIRLPIPDPTVPALPPAQMDTHIGTPVTKLHGAFVGYSIGHFRYKDENGQVIEKDVLREGDDITLMTAGGADLRPVWGSFLVADYVQTGMSEYDQSFVYVPLDQLQKVRGLDGRCTALQLKLKDYDADKAAVTAELRRLFRSPEIRIDTWEERQGPLLAAIDVERGILNLLLFMIVGVAGFSILAIFTMIVTEKYRDIGILKSLGASSGGVMGIFLGYGLLLGAVGCLLGTALGLWITANINAIEAGLTRLTGRAVFPKDIYYFKEIPTNVDPLTVGLVDVGALAIAVVFSLLPAYRAARLHPVRALRFE